ncbi:TetR/AcrR family transcriptional regulator [Tomitella fengzijianii]|uniref:TetR/AcrR family transcriptional regulator n=1 Tax=Tomitella fengzijianii TaxID=2597660 RepID=UPI001E463E8A|nr:TetR/AcrR family transcriptional regulator [Tomitella fengzijianii]
MDEPRSPDAPQQSRRPRAGRPRDAAKDEAILAAARRLLAARGYQKTTIAAVSRESGVNTPAIYRRWPTRVALIEEAVHGPAGQPLPEATGDLRADVESWVHVFLARAARPSARAGVPGLLSDAQSEDDRSRLLRIGAPVRRAFTALIDAAEDRGEVPPGADTALLFEILSSSTSMRGLTRGMEEADAYVAELAGALLVLAAHHREVHP